MQFVNCCLKKCIYLKHRIESNQVSGEFLHPCSSKIDNFINNLLTESVYYRKVENSTNTGLTLVRPNFYAKSTLSLQCGTALLTALVGTDLLQIDLL